MNQLSSFAVIYVDGSMRISFAYNVVDPDSGAVLSENKRGNFVVIDEGLMSNISSIKDFIIQWMGQHPDLIKV